MKKNKRYALIIISFLLLILIVFVSTVAIRNRELPVIGLRFQRVSVDKGCKLVCAVYNRSNKVMHFKDFNIARGVIRDSDLNEIELITNDETIVLKADSDYYTEFIIEDIESGQYQAEVTTKCREGSQMTLTIQFDVP